MASISVKSVSAWTQEIKNDAGTQLGASVLQNFNAEEALVDRSVVVKNNNRVFNTFVSVEGLPVTNQKLSGRCWLFASGNVLRLNVIDKLKVKEFQFSQLYWFFWDKFEKCNYFLEQFSNSIDSLPETDLDSRLIQHLLEDPTCDGGQMDMFVNVVNKYGMIPHELYPDAYSATASRTLNFLLKTKLREWAQELREAKKDKRDTAKLRLDYQKETFRLLVMFLGQPPLPEEKLVWSYQNKDEKVETLEFTPLLFREHTEDVSLWVSLLHDPRNKANSVISIDKLGNVVGERNVGYLNVGIDDLARYAIERLKNNQAVFFGTHTPIYMDKKRGIMNEKLYNYHLINFTKLQDKASRIRYRQLLMTHAMTLTAVHLDLDGNPVRWKVENSWGKDVGLNGYWVMDHDYFKEYVYEVVVAHKQMSSEHQKIWTDHKDVVVLPPWDPMGALAM